MHKSDVVASGANFLANKVKIIDISRPISERTACFPGDTRFSREVVMTMEHNICNLSSLTMSPHLGTHADSPIHVYGEMQGENDTAGTMPLEPFVGDAYVVDLAPFEGVITKETLKDKLPDVVPERVLFKTAEKIHYDVYQGPYASIAPEVIELLAARQVKLLGIDTHSIDHMDSDKLETHKKILQCGMYLLESLDLTHARSGRYFLIALPLKFMQLEASPVRAVLLASDEDK